MAMEVSLLTADSTATASDPQDTASVSPAANSVLLVCVSMRATDVNDFPVTVSGGGLSWSIVGAVVDHDNAGTRSQMAMWRATCGASPGTFAISLDQNTAEARGMLWHVVEVTEVDTTTDDGEVQNQRGDSGQVLDLNVELTFGAAPDAANTVVGFLSIQQINDGTLTEHSGFTELSDIAPTDSEQSFVQYVVGSSPTVIDHVFAGSTGYPGAIQIELKFDAGVGETYSKTIDLNARQFIKVVR